MTRIGWPCLALLPVLALAACDGAAGTSPEATFAAAQKATAEQRWGDLYDLLDLEMIDRKKLELEPLRTADEQIRKELCADLGITPDEAKSLSVRDYFILVTKLQAEARPETLTNLANASVVGVKRDGDRATLTYKTGEGREESMVFVRRESRWLIARW
jgi:hypothetical protein